MFANMVADFQNFSLKSVGVSGAEVKRQCAPTLGLNIHSNQIKITSETPALGSRLEMSSQTRDNQPSSKRDGGNEEGNVEWTWHTWVLLGIVSFLFGGVLGEFYYAKWPNEKS
jgi:hypothetical protein